MPSTKDLLKAKIAAMKAEFEPDSISPSYLGEILDDMVDEHDMIAKIREYVEFDGFVSGKTINENQSTSASDDAGKAVYYDSTYNTFLLFNVKKGGTTTIISDSGYVDWKDGDNFGMAIATGREPYDGKLYADVSTGRLYRAEVGSLVLVGSGFKSLHVEQEGQNYTVQALDILGKPLSGVSLPVPLFEVSWKQLQELRRINKLIPGQMYRITDYITTVANDPEAQSAGHPFDIVVMALSANSLSEHALAMRSTRDTDGYFADAKLEAWKVWYCIDNDTTRFQWADTTNGKGVIYRLIDEWQNDCPYDFKNIQFRRYKIINGSQQYLSSLFGSYLGLKDGMNRLVFDNNDYTWAYTFSLIKGEECTDASVSEITRNCQCENNHIRGYFTTDILDDTVFQILSLNNIVCITDVADMPSTRTSTIRYNSFGLGCYSITLFGLPCNNTFGYCCACNIVGGSNNTFGYKYSGNSFGIMCNCNTFGNECMDNIIGDSASYNTFGNECFENLLGKGSLRNTLSGRCVHNELTSGCLDNKLSDYCRNNIFGEDCQGNSFNCNCSAIELGDGCVGNTFGVSCNHIKLGNNYQSNTVGNDVVYLDIDNEAGTRENVRYVNILNGTKLSANSYTVIPCPEDAPYSFLVGIASDGTPRMGFLADLL